jgi:hypothetical protein
MESEAQQWGELVWDSPEEESTLPNGFRDIRIKWVYENVKGFTVAKTRSRLEKLPLRGVRIEKMSGDSKM